MEDAQVGAHVRERRERLKLSMRGAATRAGISPTAWSDLERGKHPPSMDTQRGVAVALGWTPSWYDDLGADETPTESDPVTELAHEAGRAVGELEARLAMLEDEIKRGIAGTVEINRLDEPDVAATSNRTSHRTDGTCRV